MFKKLIFPIKWTELQLFGFIFLIICLININFNILRSMRNALVVADTGGSAAFIPYFELFGTFPASILLTWVLSRLMRLFSVRFIFSVTTLFFLTFFIVFAFWLYPHREEIQTLLESKLGVLFGLSRFKVIFTHWPDMTFYIMSELWKVALLSVIFWGFINQSLSLDEAKRFYPPLMLGSSIGTILAGPITVFCTSQWSWNFFSLSAHRWQHALYLLALFMVFCGFLALVVFNSLFKKMEARKVTFSKASAPGVQLSASPMCEHMGDADSCEDGDAGDVRSDLFNRFRYTQEAKKNPFSLRLLSLSSSLQYLLQSPYLSALMLIVVAEYIAYALGELIFLQTLKEMYPTPSDYCQYMGNLTFYTGILTAFSALILTPYILQTCRWSRSALITPISMVLMTIAFFTVVCCGKIGLFPGSSPLPIAVILGSLHFCVGRATKYTLFDATKELAFIPLDHEAQVKGKLIIDGIGSRLGRGTSSLLSIILFLLTGGPGEGAIFAGILAVSFAMISIPSARFIGYRFEKMHT